MKGKATSFDIAHLAGVSQSTVSRALRNSPLVKPETIEKVQRIARELNYKVDKHASSLRSQQSATLALLLFEDPTTDDSLINPFFLSMLGSITRACARQGFDLLVSFQQLSDDWHADYEDSHKADGIILLGYGDDVDYQPKLQQLDRQGTRYVRWGPLSEGSGLSVGCDNRQGGQDATEHLIRLNRRRIAFIGNASHHYPEFFARYQGYVRALMEAGLSVEPALQQDAITTEQAGYDAVEALLQRGTRFDALFAASDLIAVGAMQALQAHGLRVPEDVAVMGFDDIPVARFASPPLSTVRQDTKLAGEQLVESLVRQIRGEPVRSTTIPTRLIARKSCGEG
ncbi:LacI family DNA-binding transcriptional regulator [Ferrimonas balearica]|uniref:LacI family DNA-binding transcriptional regulator n=1 Tax=Ferrimonas balearica TaxID=44012 RepID=UPI001C99323E|nr:LacI family DNA-binding transcriptional regulator [Ferrimonas balearica]MBY5921220.1 LacI family DNA-binding transcriptional regulator [Ferrimonas balearica]MBY5996095.1 LacI family DNA-binding transcriptional regulator [Ferrimonas balearica]